MQTFKDIFKSDFLNSTTLNSFSVTDTLAALVLAFVLGLFIYLIYKKLIKALCIRHLSVFRFFQCQ